MNDLGVVAPERPEQAGGNDKSDAALVRAFNEARGDLVSTLFFLLRNHADAQDAAQDTFLKCWRARRALPDIRNLRAWIFRIGLNTAKDIQRNCWRRRCRPLTPALAPSIRADLALALEEKEDLERLRQALVRLPPKRKAVFLLRQNGGLTYQEIARLQHSPVGSVKTLMRAALRTLREALNR